MHPSKSAYSVVNSSSSDTILCTSSYCRWLWRSREGTNLFDASAGVLKDGTCEGECWSSPMARSFCSFPDVSWLTAIIAWISDDALDFGNYYSAKLSLCMIKSWFSIPFFSSWRPLLDPRAGSFVLNAAYFWIWFSTRAGLNMTVPSSFCSTTARDLRAEATSDATRNTSESCSSSRA